MHTHTLVLIHLLLNGGIQLLISDEGLYMYIISSKLQFSSGSCATSQSLHCVTNGRGSNRWRNDISGKMNGIYTYHNKYKMFLSIYFICNDLHWIYTAQCDTMVHYIDTVMWSIGRLRCYTSKVNFENSK